MKTLNIPNIYLSQVHDPFLNLGIEDWLFRHVLDQQPLLLLWRNNPCVVIGRAQNPWLECNVPWLEKENIPVVRRQSGGGTVYHDLGNLNISFLSPKKYYDKHQNLTLIQSALMALGFKSSISKRNDILLHHHSERYKISGSAFRETRNHAFHHASLLIDTEIDQLWHALTPAVSTDNSKGVKSVRSPVITLKQAQPAITTEAIEQQLIHQFSQYHQTNKTVLEITDKNCPPQAQTYAETIQHWDWVFGKTLPFSLTWQPGVELQIKHGLIERIVGADSEKESIFKGQRFDQVF